VQPLTVTQIALIERDLHTRSHTGIYVSNFIARAISHREMRLCARFSRVHVFLRARVLTLPDSDQLGVVYREREIADSVKSEKFHYRKSSLKLVLNN